MRESKGIKPQDILVLAKIIVKRSLPWRQLDLAYELGLSQSEIAQSLERLSISKLLRDRAPVKAAVLEFLIHGLKYVFPVEPGPVSRGMPTSHSAKPLSKKIISEKDDVYVWPYAEGDIRGHSIKPLYPSVPEAAKKDEKLHELLSLIDALRVGKVREVKLASEYLREQFQGI